jgi:hypothetical protein
MRPDKSRDETNIEQGTQSRQSRNETNIEHRSERQNAKVEDNEMHTFRKHVLNFEF